MDNDLSRQQNDLVTIGQILTTHGIQGQVRVRSWSDFPDRFSQLKKVILNLAGDLTEVAVASTQPHKQFILFKFVGFDRIEEVQKWQKALVQIPKGELYPLPAGHYYHFQILGLRVYTEQREDLGRIQQILQTGSNDVYLVANEEGKEFLIPALREVVRSIDLGKAEMVIRPLPGLLEL